MLAQSEGTPDFARVVARLNTISVRKRHDPISDLPWEDKDSAIDPRDPRFCLREDEPLGATAWYRSLPQDTRARLGLEFLCQTMHFGIALENTLSRGLLMWVRALPPRSPAFRYALHEVVEESQHSQMFRQFIDKSGCEPAPLHWFDAWSSDRIERLAGSFPEMFFIWVLAGEIFVDADNRMRLERRSELHPLVARIMQIHVTEEARHMRFAETFLAAQWPKLSRYRRMVVRTLTPISMLGTAKVMMEPSPTLVRRFGIPRGVLREAFGANTPHRARMNEIQAPVLALLRT